MKALKSFLFLFLVFNADNIQCQLMDHGDRELNQILLFSKYLNESRNVQHLLYSEVKNQTTFLRDNVESSIYNISSLTLLDRQTCFFIGAVINSNSRHFKNDPYGTLMRQLEQLQDNERKLDKYVMSQSANLKDVSKISLDTISLLFEKINESQNNLILTLESIDFENECEACKEPIKLYQEITRHLNAIGSDKKQDLKEMAEGINIEKWNEFSYPKELLSTSIDKMKEVINAIERNRSDENIRKILDEYYFKPTGVTQLLNEALLKYKNQNKEVKYLGQLVPKLIMK